MNLIRELLEAKKPKDPQYYLSHSTGIGNALYDCVMAKYITYAQIENTVHHLREEGKLTHEVIMHDLLIFMKWIALIEKDYGDYKNIYERAMDCLHKLVKALGPDAPSPAELAPISQAIMDPNEHKHYLENEIRNSKEDLDQIKAKHQENLDRLTAHKKMHNLD